MTKNKIISLMCPVIFLAFGIFIKVSASSMSARDASFPNLVAYLIIGVSIIQLIVDFRKKDHKDRFQGVNFLKIAECVAAMCLYIFLLKKIGFFIDTLLLTAFTMYALEYKNYKILAVSSVIITIVVFAVFKWLLRVPLPTIWL